MYRGYRQHVLEQRDDGKSDVLIADFHAVIPLVCELISVVASRFDRRSIINELPIYPLVNADTVAERYNVSSHAAHQALVRLAGDDILTERSFSRRTKAGRPRQMFTSTELIDLLSEIIALGTDEDPMFPQKVKAALDQRVLMRDLADARIAAHLSQTKLAAAAGTSQSQIARAESGDVDVRLSTVARMAAALGKRIEWTLIDAESRETESALRQLSGVNPRATPVLARDVTSG